MKIGIFGDSFADVSSDPIINSWPNFVQQNLDAVVDNYAKSGTSLWWAYEQFQKFYKNYDIIIFSFTAANRWPHLPKKFTGNHWNVGQIKDNSLLDRINPYFDTVFSTELLAFLGSAIHKNVLDRCQEENKYLVQLLPFLHYKKEYYFDSYFTPIQNKFPLISGLSIISHLEEIIVNGTKTILHKFLKTVNMIDYRGCHLHEHNNKIIADWITNCIREKKFDVHFKCDDNLNNWNFLDINGYEKLQRNLKK